MCLLLIIIVYYEFFFFLHLKSKKVTIYIPNLQRTIKKWLFKGLEPKLHVLALSLGENKTEFERYNFAQTFAKYHSIDINIKFCVGNSLSVTIWLETGRGIAKLPIFSRNLCLYASDFLGRHPWIRMKICIQLYGLVRYTMYRFYSGSRLAPNKTIYTRRLAKSERAQRFQTLRSKIRGSRSWYQIKGLARRNTHVKYESPSTNQSKVITKVKVCWRTDRLIKYYRAPDIIGTLTRTVA
jgi:hypothetical protein